MRRSCLHPPTLWPGGRAHRRKNGRSLHKISGRAGRQRIDPGSLPLRHLRRRLCGRGAGGVEEHPAGPDRLRDICRDRPPGGPAARHSLHQRVAGPQHPAGALPDGLADRRARGDLRTLPSGCRDPARPLRAARRLPLLLHFGQQPLSECLLRARRVSHRGGTQRLRAGRVLWMHSVAHRPGRTAGQRCPPLFRRQAGQTQSLCVLRDRCIPILFRCDHPCVRGRVRNRREHAGCERFDQPGRRDGR